VRGKVEERERIKRTWQPSFEKKEGMSLLSYEENVFHSRRGRGGIESVRRRATLPCRSLCRKNEHQNLGKGISRKLKPPRKKGDGTVRPWWEKKTRPFTKREILLYFFTKRGEGKTPFPIM